MQCEVLALEIHLLQIIALFYLGSYTTKDRRALEALCSHKRISTGYGIVVVNSVLLLEVGIFALCLVHHVFILYECVHGAAEYDILG